MEIVNQDKAIENQDKKNQNNICDMVLESYQDMLAGKGRSYHEFFAEMEGRYKNAGI